MLFTTISPASRKSRNVFRKSRWYFQLHLLISLARSLSLSLSLSFSLSLSNLFSRIIFLSLSVFLSFPFMLTSILSLFLLTLAGPTHLARIGKIITRQTRDVWLCPFECLVCLLLSSLHCFFFSEYSLNLIYLTNCIPF